MRELPQLYPHLAPLPLHPHAALALELTPSPQPLSLGERGDPERSRRSRGEGQMAVRGHLRRARKDGQQIGIKRGHSRGSITPLSATRVHPSPPPRERGVLSLAKEAGGEGAFAPSVRRSQAA